MFRVLLALALAPLVAGCQLLAGPTPSPTLVVWEVMDISLGGGVTLHTEAQDNSWESENRDCADRVHRLTTPTGEYQVAAIKAGCVSTLPAGNGFHGYYREVPAGVQGEKVGSPLGWSWIFSNRYYECTNSCANGTDEVALVPDGDRVIQVIAISSPGGPSATRSRDDLVEVLNGLSRTK